MAGRHDETILGYCDKTGIENYLLLDIDSSFDTQIDSWIAAAEKFVNNYTGYTTASGMLLEEITDEVDKAYVDSDCSLIITPRKIPISSVTSISLIKGTDSLDLELTSGDGETRYNIPSSNDYISYPDYELSITGSSIISTFRDIMYTDFFAKMSYIAGYSEVPYPVRQATINLVSDMVMRHTNKEALEQITQGKITKRWKERDDGYSDFHRDAIELLKPYRISSRWL